MNKNFSAIILSAALICMVSCTIKSEYATSEEYVDKLTNNEELKIDKNGMSITAEQAINIATLFNAKSPITKSNTLKQTKDVVTISDKEGNSLMYAVNYKNDKGFTIVGASRNYYPILAFVEKGAFDDSYKQTGMDVWMDEQICNIQYFDKLPADSTKKFRAMWSEYEKNPKLSVHTKTGDELMALRDSCIAEWEAQGYTCYPLSECQKQGGNGSYYYNMQWGTHFYNTNGWYIGDSVQQLRFPNDNYRYLRYDIVDITPNN